MWNTPFSFEELSLKVSLIEWSTLENSIQEVEGLENATSERRNQRTRPSSLDQKSSKEDMMPLLRGEETHPPRLAWWGQETCFRSLQRVDLGTTCWTKLKEEGYCFNLKMISTMLKNNSHQWNYLKRE